MVKIDNSRFGYQDIVRDIIGLPISSGWYTMKFDLYVANNSVAEFLTEKTGSYGAEQGFKFISSPFQTQVAPGGHTWVGSSYSLSIS